MRRFMPLIESLEDSFKALGVIPASPEERAKIKMEDVAQRQVIPLEESMGCLLQGKPLAEWRTLSPSTPSPAAPEKGRNPIQENTSSDPAPKPAAEACGMDHEGDDEEEDPWAEESVDEDNEYSPLFDLYTRVLEDAGLTDEEIDRVIDITAERPDIIEGCFEEALEDLLEGSQEPPGQLMEGKRRLKAMINGKVVKLQKSSAAAKRAAKAYYRANKAKIGRARKMRMKKPAVMRQMAKNIKKAIRAGTRQESVEPEQPANFSDASAPASDGCGGGGALSEGLPLKNDADAATKLVDMVTGGPYSLNTKSSGMAIKQTKVQNMGGKVVISGAIESRATMDDMARAVRAFEAHIHMIQTGLAKRTGNDLVTIQTRYEQKIGDIGNIKGGYRRPFVATFDLVPKAAPVASEDVAAEAVEEAAASKGAMRMWYREIDDNARDLVDNRRDKKIPEGTRAIVSKEGANSLSITFDFNKAATPMTAKDFKAVIFPRLMRWLDVDQPDLAEAATFKSFTTQQSVTLNFDTLPVAASPESESVAGEVPTLMEALAASDVKKIVQKVQSFVSTNKLFPKGTKVVAGKLGVGVDDRKELHITFEYPEDAKQPGLTAVHQAFVSFMPSVLKAYGADDTAVQRKLEIESDGDTINIVIPLMYTGLGENTSAGVPTLMEQRLEQFKREAGESLNRTESEAKKGFGMLAEISMTLAGKFSEIAGQDPSFPQMVQDLGTISSKAAQLAQNPRSVPYPQAKKCYQNFTLAVTEAAKAYDKAVGEAVGFNGGTATDSSGQSPATESAALPWDAAVERVVDGMTAGAKISGAKKDGARMYVEVSLPAMWVVAKAGHKQGEYAQMPVPQQQALLKSIVSGGMPFFWAEFASGITDRGIKIGGPMEARKLLRGSPSVARDRVTLDVFAPAGVATEGQQAPEEAVPAPGN